MSVITAYKSARAAQLEHITSHHERVLHIERRHLEQMKAIKTNSFFYQKILSLRVDIAICSVMFVISIYDKKGEGKGEEENNEKIQFLIIGHDNFGHHRVRWELVD
jgi:hypothetical protein